MSQTRLNPRHIATIAVNSVRFALRGGAGLVYLFLTLFLGMYLAHFALLPIQSVKQELENMGVEDISSRDAAERYVRHSKEYANWVVKHLTFVGLPKADDADDGEAVSPELQPWFDYLWKDRPALLSALWLVLLFLRPMFTVTGAFNQFSGDVSSKGLRYQLFRTSRSNLFFGRFLGTAAFNTAVMAFLCAVVGFFVAFVDDLYDLSDVLSWTLWAFVAFSIVSLPYIAVCSWISSAIDSPFGSMMVCVLSIGAVPVAVLIAREHWEPLNYVSCLLPWGVQNHIFHPDFNHWAGTIVACLLYTAVFLFIGHRHFSKRDL